MGGGGGGGGGGGAVVVVVGSVTGGMNGTVVVVLDVDVEVLVDAVSEAAFLSLASRPANTVVDSDAPAMAAINTRPPPIQRMRCAHMMARPLRSLPFQIGGMGQ